MTGQLLIGGAWTGGAGGTYQVVDPATERVVGHVPEASAADALAAARAARQAQPAWEATPPAERAQLLLAVADRLRDRADELLPLVVAETGGTVSAGAAIQVPTCARRFERYARSAPETRDTAFPPAAVSPSARTAGGLVGAVGLRRPVGVVACITAYNFPLANMASKVAPALAMGNTVVMKPAPQDPLAVIELARICDEVGMPPGVVNLVTASTPTIGSTLVATPDVDMISFTGSTGVGVRIYHGGARTMKRLLMELGGKGACLVLDDADVDAAVAALATTWSFHAGQVCRAPTRAIVQRGVYDRVVERLAAVAPSLPIGPPTDPHTTVGPVISGAHRARIEDVVRSAVEDGAELVTGGERPPFERGFYVAPTLLAGCRSDMRAVRDEIFGPVIVVLPFDDVEDGIRLANDSEYGLQDYVYSGDTSRAYAVAKRLRSGSVSVNTTQLHGESPFGGFKMSGVGRDGGDFSLGAYSELQSIAWSAP